MDLLSRQEAINIGSKYFYTGRLCKHGHDCKRSVNNRSCYQCQLIKAEQFRSNNPDYHHAYNAEYYPNNKDKSHQCGKRYVTKQLVENPEFFIQRKKEIHKEYRLKNSVSIKRRNQEWTKANKGIVNAQNAKRRARLLHATPSWSDTDNILQIYHDCTIINEMAAMNGAIDYYVVDHVVPLQGKLVCGLHISANLQLLLNTDNCKKINKWPIV